MEIKPHKELCEFVLSRDKQKKLILMPRGSFKSSVTTVGYTLFSLIRDPNMRILITGETQKNAKKFLAEVKTHIEQNQKFRTIFGNWKSRENIWREDEILMRMKY